MKSMLSQLLSLAAPDIRTTLNTIQGTLSLVGDRLNGKEEQTLVQHANLSIQHLISLLQTVSDLDLIENESMAVTNERVDVKHLLESIVDTVLLDPRSSHVSILVTYEENVEPVDLDELVVDREKFTESFSNVLQYAVLFSRRDRVDIQVSKSTEGRVAIQILDSSLGLSPAELDNLFSFDQWSGDALDWSVSNGIELNLNICLARALMRLAGGDVRATSEIGKGIRWLIELPLGAQIQLSLESRSTSSTSLKQISELAAAEALHTYATNTLVAESATNAILLVDDSPSNRLVLKSILVAAGYAVDVAGDGMEALSAVRQKSYAAVLMDLAMPKMDGLTAAREIRNLPGDLARVPLIAITAYVSDSDRRNCVDAGFNEFLTKPVQDKDLLTTLSSVLGVRDRENLEATMPIERLSEYAKIIGVVGVFNLLERFSAELLNRSQMLEVIQLGNLPDVKHNLYMLVCSAENFGFESLALAAKNLGTRLSENQLKFLPHKKFSDPVAPGAEFWAEELAALNFEISRTHTFLATYVGEHLDLQTDNSADGIDFSNDRGFGGKHV